MDTDKIRQWLNALFMIGALASVILYFAMDDKQVFFYVCLTSLCLKVVEFFIRFTR